MTNLPEQWQQRLDEPTLLKIPKEEDEELVLLQLPSNFDLDCFLRQQQEDDAAFFLGKDKSSRCCFITNSTTAKANNASQSFDVHRVETSNTLVLLPPSTNTTATTTNTTTIEPPPKKKQKIIHQTISAHLLGQQPRVQKSNTGDGAYFLELKERSLDLGALLELLTTKYTLYPKKKKTNHDLDDEHDMESKTQTNWTGITLKQLALDLQLSKAQVEAGLDKISTGHDVCLVCHEGHFGSLSEEALQEAQNLIVATLLEVPSLYGDYGGSGVDPRMLVKDILKRYEEDNDDDGTYPELEAVIWASLKQLKTAVNENNNDKWQLDFSKIATLVAHQVFCRQPKWNEETKLLQEWQARVPGVGPVYDVSLNLLHGVAVQKRAHEWHYFPAKWHKEGAVGCLAKCFAFKGRWTLKELEPHLGPLLRSNEESLEDFLLQHATRQTSNRVDVPDYYYHSAT